jgi:hypothetical protein
MTKKTAALICLSIGGIGGLFVLGNLGSPWRLGSQGMAVLACVLLVSLVLLGTGFFLLLAWLEQRKAAKRVPSRLPQKVAANAPGGVYGLQSGVIYRVLKPFKDYYGGEFAAGEQLTFIERHYLPYHGGHTLIFSPRSIWLQDDANSELVQQIEQYLAPVGWVSGEGVQVFAHWQVRSSATEYLHLEVLAAGVRTYLNNPAAIDYFWSFDEVLAGNADQRMLRNFEAKTLEELKEAVRKQPKPAV